MGTHEATFRKAPFTPLRIPSGVYIGTAYGQTSTGLLTQNTLYAYPWAVPNPITLTRLSVDVTTAGEAGSVLRLGIFYDNGTTIPDVLLLDAGTVAGDAIAQPEITISQALNPGIYWLSTVAQVCPTTPPTVRILSVGAQPGVSNASLPGSGQTYQGMSRTGISGALPANFGAVTVASSPPRMTVKTA